MKKFQYIDLFAGIGGFHQAMTRLNGECVFASEIDKYAIKTYKLNYGINSDNDIRKVNPAEIPEYQVLCAGFPCQAFSKAGNQAGFNDETKGTLFFEIERLLKYRVEEKNPVKYIILENVSNLITHDKGRTWEVIKNHLDALGYILNDAPITLSPHQLGIPQLRNRVFILGIHKSFGIEAKITLPDIRISEKNVTSIESILTRNRVEKKYYINDYEKLVLSIWDEFYRGINRKTIGFPVWSNYFNNEKIDPELSGWKKIFISKNQQLYKENKTFIDSWLIKHNNLNDLVETHKKFEWQAGESIKSIWEGIIQFRPSGVRVKRPSEFPALVAMVHVPIVGKYKRRLTPKEVSRLQSFPNDFIIDDIDQQAYKQFGNSVNVDVVEYLAKQLFDS